MEPVKIDFLIDGNVESEGTKIEQTLNDITQSSKKAILEARQAVKDQKGIVKAIENDIKSIQKQLDKAPYGKQRELVQAELNAAKKALAEDKAILKSYEQKVIELSSSHRNLSTDVRLTRDALAKMEEQGLRGTPVYNAMAEKLGKLTNSMNDANVQARILADDHRGLKAITQSVSGLAGGITAATGAISMFAGENENLAKVQTRLQSLMAVTIGLQQMADAINKDSYSRIILVNKAKQMWAKSQAFLNVQLGIGAVASKALMATGIGLLIAGVGMLVYKLNQWKNKQAEINQLQKEHIDLEASVAGAVADEKIKLQNLLKIANNYNRSLSIRKDAIRRIKEMAPEYNGYIDNEGKLVGNADTALKNYLATLIKVERAKKIMTNLVKLDEKTEKEKQTPVKSLSVGDKALSLMASMGSAMGSRYGNDFKSYADFKNDFRKGYKADKEKRLEELNKQKTDYEKQLENLLSDDKVYKSLFGGKKHFSSSKNEVYDHEKAINEQLSKLRAETTRIRLEQMADGLDKELALIDQKGKDKVDKIKAENQKIVDAYNEQNPTKKAKTLFDIDPTKAQEIANEIKKIEKNSQKEKQKVRDKYKDKQKQELQKLLDEYKTYEQQKTDVLNKYKNQREKLKGQNMIRLN